jgi:amidase
MSAAFEIAGLDAVGQADLVRRGDVSAVELVTWAIERIEVLNPALNAVVTPIFDRALARAAQASAGPFAGVPYLLKDLATEMEGVPFSEGSRFLRNYVSGYDSELVRRLQRAGLIILGKTNTPEFGMVPTCEPVLWGPTRNPWDTAPSTSGSSGGSAAAVAQAWCRPRTAMIWVVRFAFRRRRVVCLVSSRRARATRWVRNTATLSAAGRWSTR